MSLVLASCDSGMKDNLKEDFTSHYVYFSDSPDVEASARNVERDYKIGTKLAWGSSLPTVADDSFAELNVGYNINGWKYYKNPIDDTTETPKNIVCDSDNVIISLTVTSNPAWLYVSSWTPVTYYVAFDANGGSGSMANQEFTYDEAQGLSANVFTRNGYEFNGWNYEANKSKTSAEYEDGESVQNLAAKEGAVVTLYACWIKEKIAIAFDANGGTGYMDTLTGVSVEYTLPANTFSKTGYSFAGWNTAADGSGISYADKDYLDEYNWPNENIILYAQWAPNPYTLTYHANDGTEAATAFTVYYETETGILSANDAGFARAGYDFAYWATASDARYNAGDTLTVGANDIDLYAQWTVQSYTVTFDANGGSGTMASETFVYTELPKTLTAHTYTFTGYNFTGWNTASDGSGVSYADEASITADNWLTSDFTLYAQWALIPFTVTYDANDGSGSQTTQVFYYGQSQALYDAVFSRTGYDFNGWNTAADGSGTSYTGYQMLTITDGDVTLYAQWQVQTLTIVFDANGGSASSGDTQITQTLTFEDLPVSFTDTEFTRTGYYFDYWMSASGQIYAKSGSVTSSNWDLLYGSTGMIVLSANWTNRATIVGNAPTSGLSYSIGDTAITFSVSDTYLSYSWQLDGSALSETGASVSIDYDSSSYSSDFYTKIHTIIVLAYYYDAELGANIPHVLSATFKVHE